jgi:hypothetical protein
MKRTILTSIGLCSFALVACGGTHPSAKVAETRVTSAKASHLVPILIDDDLYDAPAPAFASARVPGDYVVREITMAARKTPIVLSERVVSKDGASAVLEVSIKDGKKTDVYRVRVEETASGEQTTEVTRMIAGKEHAFGISAYEAVMAKTVPAVDRNDGVVDAEPVTIDISGKKVAATRTEYKVAIGGKPATMSVVESKAMGDMGGEIAGADGKVLFRARIVEMGSAPVGTAMK